MQAWPNYSISTSPFSAALATSASARAGVRLPRSKTAIYDIDAARWTRRRAEMPFLENGAAGVLERLSPRSLRATTDPAVIAARRGVVIVVVGTPVDEHLNPDPRRVSRAP